MKIHALSTFTDWTHLAGAWGRPGVYKVFDDLRAAGITDVYWRVFNGGMAMYPSRVAQPQDRRAYDWKREHIGSAAVGIEWLRAIDFNDYDPLPDALAIAEELGINVHFWYTIFEDDHGGAFFSPFAEAHPAYWQMDRTGRTHRGTIEFFFEEVRQYKLAIVEELLRYKPRGILLDFVRHNATPSAATDGIHRFGYQPEMRAAFRDRFGVDPADLPADDERWLAFKCEPVSAVVRSVRAMMNEAVGDRPLALLVWPVDNPTWTCLDLPALTGDGTVQVVAVSSMRYAFDPQEAIDQHRTLRPQVADGVPIIPSISAYGALTNRHVEAIATAAEEAGVEALMLHEADALARWRILPGVRAVNTGRCAGTKTVEAARVQGGASTAIDWEAVPAADGFTPCGGDPAAIPSTPATRVQVAYTPDALRVRFTVQGPWPTPPAANGAGESPQQAYLDALGVRQRDHYTTRLGVLLSPGRSLGDYFGFFVTEANERSHCRYDGGAWSPRWTSTIDRQGDAQHVTFTIPFDCLGAAAPREADEWGVNFLRGLGPGRPLVSWTLTPQPMPTPQEVGTLRFGGTVPALCVG